MCFRDSARFPVDGYLNLSMRCVQNMSSDVFAAFWSAWPMSTVARFELSVFRWFAASDRIVTVGGVGSAFARKLRAELSLFGARRRFFLLRRLRAYSYALWP